MPFPEGSILFSGADLLLFWDVCLENDMTNMNITQQNDSWFATINCHKQLHFHKSKAQQKAQFHLKTTVARTPNKVTKEEMKSHLLILVQYLVYKHGSQSVDICTDNTLNKDLTYVNQDVNF